MKEFTVFRSHNLASPVGTLQVTDGFAKELAAYFKDHESMTIGAGYVKSGDEIELKEVSLMFRDNSSQPVTTTISDARMDELIQRAKTAATRGFGGGDGSNYREVFSDEVYQSTLRTLVEVEKGVA